MSSQERKKSEVMEDTWGHQYPQPGKKYYGEMVIAIGEYGDQIIVTSEFQNLADSPQRYKLEQSIFNMKDFEAGIYKIKCGMWFYKGCNESFMNLSVGKLIKIKCEEVRI